MALSQLSIFVENKPGSLNEIIGALGALEINIRALSLADTESFGILRLIVDHPERAAEKLRGRYSVKLNHVVGVRMEDRPGGLSVPLSVLADAGVSVEYAYAFIGKRDNDACVILRTDDPEKAEAALRAAGIAMVEEIE